jgi:hypothetical protein
MEGLLETTILEFNDERQTRIEPNKIPAYDQTQ